jgi:hypothetical protein
MEAVARNAVIRFPQSLALALALTSVQAKRFPITPSDTNPQDGNCSVCRNAGNLRH